MLKLLQKVIDSNPRDQTVKQTLLIIAQRYEVIQQTLSEHQSEFVFQRLIKLNDETTKYLTFIGVDVEGQLMKHFLTDAEMKARQAQMQQNTQSLQNAMSNANQVLQVSIQPQIQQQQQIPVVKPVPQQQLQKQEISFTSIPSYQPQQQQKAAERTPELDVMQLLQNQIDFSEKPKPIPLRPQIASDSDLLQYAQPQITQKPNFDQVTLFQPQALPPKPQIKQPNKELDLALSAVQNQNTQNTDSDNSEKQKRYDRLKNRLSNLEPNKTTKSNLNNQIQTLKNKIFHSEAETFENKWNEIQNTPLHIPLHESSHIEVDVKHIDLQPVIKMEIHNEIHDEINTVKQSPNNILVDLIEQQSENKHSSLLDEDVKLTKTQKGRNHAQKHQQSIKEMMMKLEEVQ
ncbi:Hypothetical_protein [Hexamita inflata]|uniref:Hypothetical_protein n=1 Tax=Hexamita inflata TaxID=28002 RepID=A0AA86U7N5_9EUKA|nr:Hypothetical protein HINF_LOCUS33855 [Hexamita inflata]